MPTFGSPSGVPQRVSLYARDHPTDLVANPIDPHSFATPSPHLTASVAPSPSPFLQDSAQTISLRAVRILHEVSTQKSPTIASRPLAINAALVAGTISVLLLVGIVGLVGIVSYRKKSNGKGGRRGEGKTKIKKVSGTTNDVEDIESSPAPLVYDSDAESYDTRSSMSLCHAEMAHLENPVATDSASLPVFASSMVASSAAPSTPMFLCSASSPWTSDRHFSPRFTLPFSSIPIRPFLDGTRTSEPNLKVNIKSELKSAVREEIDLGHVTLSSLQTYEDCGVVEHYDNDTDSTSYYKTSDAKGLALQSLPVEDNLARMETEEYFVQGEETVHSQPDVPSSWVSSASEFQTLASADGLDHTVQSMTSPSPDTCSFAGPAGCATVAAPRLPELTLESGVDLRMWMGLHTKSEPAAALGSRAIPISNIPTTPKLVATDSQETTTCRDDLLNGQVFSEGLSDNRRRDHKLEGSLAGYLPAGSVPEDRPRRESRIARFKHIITRASVTSTQTSLFTNPLQKDVAVIPEGYIRTLTTSGSSSSSSSSFSAATLQMPSFRSPGLTLLTEEVLPPPSIIVSVPTDNSILRRETWGSACEVATGKRRDGRPEQRRWSTREETGEADRVARVIYDPEDENEDGVWGEAYERTCFYEGPDAHPDRGERNGFGESWMVSSESSELDLAKAVAEFPLPPDRPARSPMRISLSVGQMCS